MVLSKTWRKRLLSFWVSIFQTQTGKLSHVRHPMQAFVMDPNETTGFFMFFFPCPRIKKGRLGSCQKRVKIWYDWYVFDNFWLCYTMFILRWVVFLSHIPPRFWCSMTPVPVRRVRAHAFFAGNWACCYEWWEIMGVHNFIMKCIIFDILTYFW